MTDDFQHHGEGLTSPPEKFATVTPNDSVDLPNRPRCICFATVGDLVVTDEDGNDTTFPSGSLAAGTWHALRPVRIKATGTTATDIIAGW